MAIIIDQQATSNGLLRSLAPEDYALLQPHFKRIALPVGSYLHSAGRRIEKVYFPEDGIVSIVAVTLDGRSCEVGLFGREGMSETATVLGTDYSPHSAYVQVVGSGALVLPVAVLSAALDAAPRLRRHLLCYCQAMMIQLSSSITAASLTIPQRLARWLLMCHDRIDGDELRLSHDFVGMMLGVRRASVTVALNDLEAGRLISLSRVRIVITDRAALEALAADSYGLAESEYTRLIGRTLGKTIVPPPAVAA